MSKSLFTVIASHRTDEIDAMLDNQYERAIYNSPLIFTCKIFSAVIVYVGVEGNHINYLLFIEFVVELINTLA